MVITHVGCSQVLAIGAHCKRGDRTTSFRKRHHLEALGRNRVPDEDHRLKANLTGSDLSAVSTHAEGDNIIAVTEFSFRHLLPLLDLLFTTTEDLLSTGLRI